MSAGSIQQPEDNMALTNDISEHEDDYPHERNSRSLVRQPSRRSTEHGDFDLQTRKSLLSPGRKQSRMSSRRSSRRSPPHANSGAHTSHDLFAHLAKHTSYSTNVTLSSSDEELRESKGQSNQSYEDIIKRLDSLEREPSGSRIRKRSNSDRQDLTNDHRSEQKLQRTKPSTPNYYECSAPESGHRIQHREKLKDAIAYIARTCTKDYVLSEIENLKRMETCIGQRSSDTYHARSSIESQYPRLRGNNLSDEQYNTPPLTDAQKALYEISNILQEACSDSNKCTADYIIAEAENIKQMEHCIKSQGHNRIPTNQAHQTCLSAQRTCYSNTTVVVILLLLLVILLSSFILSFWYLRALEAGPGCKCNQIPNYQQQERVVDVTIEQPQEKSSRCPYKH